MAKSLRSKWRRKMKAVKRERYGAKENDRLIKMLQQAGDYQVVPAIKEEPLELDNQNPLETTTIQIAEIITPVTENENKRITRTRSLSKHDERRLSRRHSRRDSGGDGEENNMETEKEEVGMEVEKETGNRTYNKKTKRDQFGNYPAWFSLRKVLKQKKKNKRLVSKAKKLKNKKK